MIQIPVMSITEADGEFVFEGPYGMRQVFSIEALNEEARDLAANYEIALKLARCHWWATRQQAADKAAHDAAHCRLITWDPTAESAVSYG
jgi:hypothetical protein